MLVCCRLDNISGNGWLHLLLISENKNLNRLVCVCLSNSGFQLSEVVDFLSVEAENNIVRINVISQGVAHYADGNDVHSSF